MLFFFSFSIQDIVLYDVMIAIIRVIFVFINNNIPILPWYFLALASLRKELTIRYKFLPRVAVHVYVFDIPIK
jgi:hypothetical protein